jgi:acetyltransferase-like isoleucine patch superfamily enzyme
LVHALRALRFTLWTVATRARLARLGIRASIAADGTPRFRTLPRLEPVPGRGALTIHIGRDVDLGRDLVLAVGAGSTLEIAAGTRFEGWCRIQLEGGVLRLGERVNVRDGCLLKSRSTLTVGDEAVIARLAAIHATAGVSIGARAGIGERTSIVDSDHTDDGRGWRASPLHAEPIAIGDDALLSANCVVLRGARIGPRAVVAAGSVVRAGEHPGGWLVAGNPAEAIRALT